MLRLATASLLLAVGRHFCSASRARTAGDAAEMMLGNASSDGELVGKLRHQCWKWLIVSYKAKTSQVPIKGTVNYESWQEVALFERRAKNGCVESYTAHCATSSISVARECPTGDGSTKTESWEECLGGVGPDVKCMSRYRTYDARGDEIWLREKHGDLPSVVIAQGSVRVWADSPAMAQAVDLARTFRNPVDEEVNAVATFVSDINGGGPRGQALMHVIKASGSHAGWFDAFSNVVSTSAVAPVALGYLDGLVGSMSVEVAVLWNTARRLRFARDRELRVFGHILMSRLIKHGGKQSSRGFIGEMASDVRKYMLLKRLSGAEIQHIVEYMKDPDEEPDQILYYVSGLSRHSIAASQKPRALIFTCSFGGGHRSAAKAVSSYLKAGGFEVEIVDTTRDPAYRSHSEVLGDYMFNEVVLKRQWYGYQNFVEKVRSVFHNELVPHCSSPRCDTQRKARFRASILELRPDIVVTVYHMDLMPILELAGELGSLPLLHIATDMDVKMVEVFGRGGAVPVYPRFKVGVPFATEATYESIKPLPREATFLSGYPVRDAFLMPPASASDLAEARAKIAPAETLLVLVMTGGGGQDVPWPTMLANGESSVGRPVHVMVVVGGNSQFAARLGESLPGRIEIVPDRTVLQGTDTRVTVEVVVDPANQKQAKPYFVGPQHLKLLMDVSDVLITKPGGGSTAEAAYRGIPAVFDATAGLLHWEEFTVREFEKIKRGIRMNSEQDLADALKAAISYGRSSLLAQDPEQPGAVIDTGRAVRDAARRLLATPCMPPCLVFTDDVLD